MDTRVCPNCNDISGMGLASARQTLLITATMSESGQSVGAERSSPASRGANTARFELPPEGFALGELFEGVLNAHSNVSDREGLLDDVFDILASQRRRYILYCLRTHDSPLALADVADEVTVYEHDTDITDISAEEIKRVYMSLYHTHIPKLAERDLVTYSQERDLVTLSETGKQLSVIVTKLSAIETTNGDTL